MKIHPIADLFPMLPDEDLQALAADIKDHGLIQPLVRDAEGQLIDGRNRLAACKLAGVEPRFEELNGNDPVDYILSVNSHRRFMTKGQLAMIWAEAKPDPGKGGRGKKGIPRIGFSDQRLSHARTVLRHSHELADAVRMGTTSLNDAYRAVQQEQAVVRSREAQLERIRQSAPELIDLVNEERMTLADALAATEERERQTEQMKNAAYAAVNCFQDFPGRVADYISGVKIGAADQVTPALMKQLTTAIDHLVKFKKKGEPANESKNES